MSWKIKTTSSFREDLEDLDKKTRERIVQKMRWLVNNFDKKPPLIRHLPEELKGLRKYRIGDWRVFLWCDDEKKEVVLYGVGHRREIYKELSR